MDGRVSDVMVPQAPYAAIPIDVVEVEIDRGAWVIGHCEKVHFSWTVKINRINSKIFICIIMMMTMIFLIINFFLNVPLSKSLVGQELNTLLL